MDLLGRYSNLRELQNEFKELYKEMEKQSQVKRGPPVATHIHKIEMRLGMETIQQIVTDYRKGFTSTQLMAEYSIGKTSMLRLLHEAGAITPGRRNHRKPASVDSGGSAPPASLPRRSATGRYLCRRRQVR